MNIGIISAYFYELLHGLIIYIEFKELCKNENGSGHIQKRKNIHPAFALLLRS